MNTYYDKNAKLREYEEIRLVLVWKPDLLGKLEDMWDGPFEIQKRLRDVLYKLTVPGRRTAKRRVHVNMLQEWRQGVLL